MNYLNRYLKYKSKIELYGGDAHLSPLLRKRTDMILYTITSGGDADTILSIISDEYNNLKKINENKKKNYNLGIKQIDKFPATIDFKIIPYNEDLVFKSGTYSAIYELKNQYNLSDNKKYILRLFDHTDIHLLGLKKVRNEYDIFLKYLIHIYYYGTLHIVKIGKVKPILIDYLITKKYNNDSSTFTLSQKYKFLINNIQMLLDLRIQNCFHSDYKLSNIGWDDELNIILIDYDKNTIMKITDQIITKIRDNDNIITRLTFHHTYIPKYLMHSNKIFVNDSDISTYDKFSVGGLVEIILKLQFPIDLITEFRLNDSYENIFTYEKMLEKLKISSSN